MDAAAAEGAVGDAHRARVVNRAAVHAGALPLKVLLVMLSAPKLEIAPPSPTADMRRRATIERRRR